MTITLSDPDTGDDLEVQLPSRKCVCPTCEGEGYVLNPSMRGHAYAKEEFDDAFDDEQRAEYLKRGGIYDVVCETCNGRNVVDEVAEDQLTPAQLVQYEAWCESQRADAEYEAVCRAEREMGA
jgi:hypothetical protein